MAHRYRLARWSDLAKERVELGMSIRAFCAMKGFAENTYFYWQRKLRDAACAQMEREGVNPTPSFTQVALVPKCTPAATDENSGQLVVQINNIHLCADSNYPPRN